MSKHKTIALQDTIAPEYLSKIVDWSQTMSMAAIAKRLEAEGQGTFHRGTIGRYLLKMRGRIEPAIDRATRPQIDVVLHNDIPNASSAFRDRQRDLARSVEQLELIDAELVLLASDSDSLIYETGPLIQKNGRFEREFVIDERTGRRKLLSPEAANIRLNIEKKRIAALQARQRGIVMKAGIFVAYAKLELMVKGDTAPLTLQPGEADAIATQATEDEIKLIESGDTKALSRVLERIRGR